MASTAELSRRWFEEFWNKRRPEAMEELLAADVIAHGLGDGGTALAGPAGFKLFADRFQNAFPDLHVRVEDVISEGDKTAVRFSFTGTHHGDGLGIAATKRPIRVTGMCFIRWRAGKIVEAWNEFDAAAMLQQIGAMAAKARP